MENVSQGVIDSTNNGQLSLSSVANSAVSATSGLLSAASAVYSAATTQQGTQPADSGGLGSPHITRVVQFNSGARSKQAKRGLEQVDRTTDELESPAALKTSVARLEKLASELIDDALLKDEEIKRLRLEAEARAEAFAKLTAHAEQLTRSLDELANAVNSRQVQNDPHSTDLLNEDNRWVTHRTKLALKRANATVPAVSQAELGVANFVASELEERNRRRRNVVLFGLEQSKSSNAEDARMADERQIKKILVELGINAKCMSSHRRFKLREMDKLPPVLVSLTDSGAQQEVLAAAKKLKQSASFAKVFIHADMTAGERIEHKRLIALRRNARNNVNGNNNKLEAATSSRLAKSAQPPPARDSSKGRPPCQQRFMRRLWRQLVLKQARKRHTQMQLQQHPVSTFDKWMDRGIARYRVVSDSATRLVLSRGYSRLRGQRCHSNFDFLNLLSIINNFINLLRQHSISNLLGFIISINSNQHYFNEHYLSRNSSNLIIVFFSTSTHFNNSSISIISINSNQSLVSHLQHSLISISSTLIVYSNSTIYYSNTTYNFINSFKFNNSNSGNTAYNYTSSFNYNNNSSNTFSISSNTVSISSIKTSIFFNSNDINNLFLSDFSNLFHNHSSYITSINFNSNVYVKGLSWKAIITSYHNAIVNQVILLVNVITCLIII